MLHLYNNQILRGQGPPPAEEGEVGTVYYEFAYNATSNLPEVLATWIKGLDGWGGRVPSTGVPGPRGPQGDQGIPGPRGITPRGAWASAATYVLNDTVSDNGTQWRALRTNTNVVPGSNALDWEVFASKGDPGAAPPAATTASASRALTAGEEFVIASPAFGTTLILTLPDASNARAQGYIIKNVGEGTVAVVPSTGDTIDGKASISTDVRYEAVQLRPAAPNAWHVTTPIQPETVVRPHGAFRVHLSVAQSIASATFTKVNFDVEGRDRDGWFVPFDAASPAATARYNPKRPGYYDFSGGCYYPSPVATSRCVATLFKNGAQYAHLDMKHTSNTFPMFVGGALSRVEMNGTSDYVELHTYHDFGVAKDINGGPNQMYFQGGFAEEF